MATVTFILGLCGSGKSYLASQMLQVTVIDESFFAKKQELFGALQHGKDCAVVEIAFCFKDQRDEFIKEINTVVPGVRINWLCIENDLRKANLNCYGRDKPDPAGHVNMNLQFSPNYTYPDGAIILKMWPPV